MTAGAATGPRTVGTIWFMALADVPAPVEALLPATFGQLGNQAQDELAAAMRLADADEVRRRFAGGRRCYAARVAGALAAYGWVSFNEEVVGGLGLRLLLLPGEAYIWDCATAPAFRRQRLYTALLVAIVAALRAEGQCRAWIGADYDNRPSQAGIARAGFTAVADLVAARGSPDGRLRRAWLVGRPAIGQEQVADARRVYLGGREVVWLPASDA